MPILIFLVESNNIFAITEPSQHGFGLYGRYPITIPGTLAAGDARRGQSLVVWAMNEGRGVETAVDAYLMAE